MNRNVIITCAITGSGNSVGKHPSIPVTPEEIADAAIEAAKAGAAIAHIHVRDPESGAASRRVELYREVVDRIRESDTDVVINLCQQAVPEPQRFKRVLEIVPYADDERDASRVKYKNYRNLGLKPRTHEINK